MPLEIQPETPVDDSAGPPDRKSARIVGLFALLGCLFAGPLLAPAQAQGNKEITPRAERAIKRGLDFLASRQNEDGSFTEMIGRKVNNEYRGSMGKHVGVTSLACLAFISNGSTPGRGPYGENLERGLDFVLSQVRKDNGFITSSQSRMYSHGFATLFLAEVYGSTRDDRVREKLQLAVDCLVQNQNEMGGWRYLPGSEDADISITVTAVQALRAARNGGIYVPRETIDHAVEYVKLSHVRQSFDRDEQGGFWYQIGRNQPFMRSRTSFALTAAGVTALYGAGEYDAAEVRAGLAYLHNPRNRPDAWRMTGSFDYFYSHYYAVQAMYQAGGDHWKRWFPRVRDEILGGMNESGHWEDLVGPVYATAMATIILQIPYRYLPIFER